MCYAKPGPRCSNHTRKDLNKALKALEADPQNETLRDAAQHAADEYAKTPDGIKAIKAEARTLKAEGKEEEAEARLADAEAAQAARQEALDAYKLSKGQEPTKKRDTKPSAEELEEAKAEQEAKAAEEAEARKAALEQLRQQRAEEAGEQAEGDADAEPQEEATAAPEQEATPTPAPVTTPPAATQGSSEPSLNLGGREITADSVARNPNASQVAATPAAPVTAPSNPERLHLPNSERQLAEADAELAAAKENEEAEETDEDLTDESVSPDGDIPSEAAATKPRGFRARLGNTYRVSQAKNAASQSEDADELAAYAQHDDPQVRQAAAARVDVLPSEEASGMLTQLANDPDSRVRQAVAANTNTPVEVLREFSKPEADPALRAAVAGNYSTPADLLDRLSYGDDKTRIAVAGNRSTPPALLKELGTNPSSRKQLVAVLGNRNTPPSFLRAQFVADKKGVTKMKGVKEALATNPSTPHNVLTQLARSDDKRVADAAQVTLRDVASNENTDRTTLIALAEQKDNREVQKIARKTLGWKTPWWKRLMGEN